jgi:fatty acid desaturase
MVQSKMRWGHWGTRPVKLTQSVFPLPAAALSRWGEGQGEGRFSMLGTEREPLTLALSPLDAGRGKTAIPEPLNWFLLFISLLATSACLWLASHAVWWLALLACIVFAFVNNLPFALMHEAVHGLAARSQRRNAIFGILASAMFPTSFSLQRVAHIGHHARNRMDTDLYDYYLPSQSRFVRNVWLYAGNLLGLYWFCIPISNALYLLATALYRSKTFVDRIAPRLGFGPHVRDIAALPALRVWLEIAGAFVLQATLWWALDLEWKGWLLAHWLFALHWSALQYVDHAWSPRDVAQGAWNLRVFAPVRWLALNYHYHRVHHANPTVPWTALPQFADAADDPSFWQIYRSLWRHGVQPAPEMGAAATRELFA